MKKKKQEISRHEELRAIAFEIVKKAITRCPLSYLRHAIVDLCDSIAEDFLQLDNAKAKLLYNDFDILSRRYAYFEDILTDSEKAAENLMLDENDLYNKASSLMMSKLIGE